MTPETAEIIRWLTFGLVAFIFAIVVWLFNRKGLKIKPDPESKPDKPDYWG